jgi:DNA ligase (NAD+)
MNIEGIGEVLAEELVKKKLVEDPADIFDLTVEKLVPPEDDTGAVRVERMARKSAENLVVAIARAREQATLSRLLVGLGIPHVGTVAARAIAARFESFEALVVASSEARRETVAAIDGVGPVIADALADYLEDEANARLMDRLRARGVSPVEPPQRSSVEGPLAGRRVCVTGKLSRPRSEIQQEIEAAGGHFVTAVGKNTDILVAGADVGKSKLDSARKLGIRVVDEETFTHILRGEE